LRQDRAVISREPVPEDQQPQTDSAEVQAPAQLLMRLNDFARVHPKVELDEAICRRFLRARKGDMDAAANGIRKYVEWRETAKPGDLTAEDVKVEMATGKGYFHGQDRCGRSIVWAFARLHDKRTRVADETMNLILYNMETAIKTGEERGVEQICFVCDLAGFGSKNMDYEVTTRLLSLLSDCYPERLGQILLLNAPTIFNVFWRVVRPCIDPVTFKKIQFASKGVLCDFIDPAMIPRDAADLIEPAA